MYDMLGLFTYEETDPSNIKLIFQIPDNCNYAVTQAGSAYSIAIKLNAGQNNPSTTFITCTEDLAVSGKTFSSCFEQYQKSGTIIKKPKIDIGF